MLASLFFPMFWTGVLWAVDANAIEGWERFERQARDGQVSVLDELVNGQSSQSMLNVLA
jgi:hypothetical protein